MCSSRLSRHYFVAPFEESAALADNYGVTCIVKRDRTSPHERIHSVGGRGQNGEGDPWLLTEDDAIEGIQSGRFRLWVSVDNKGVWVVVANHQGRLYLKTEADGFAPNNLLNLPTCPG